jgi:hypothetical protein
VTLYQEPLSPLLRQMVTCKAPLRILCAGLDMMVVSFSWFSAPHRGLTAIEPKPPSRELLGDGQLPGENETALGKVGGAPPYLAADSQRKPVIDRPGGGFRVP